jgi:glycosyltransferase involved in cell wall biosynthesis
LNPLLSIIIPTLNEANYLKKTIKDLLDKAHKPDSLDLIVIDAGSTDGTMESIKELTVSSFSRPSFKLQKYKSLNFGIEKSGGDFLLFLDADTILPKNFDQLIKEKLNKRENVGGAFEFAFENPDWKLKTVQWINRIRYRFGHIYYGDQAVFCTKEGAIKVGGFPEKRLMETAYFCQELMKQGKLSLIKSQVKTSPRRFLENGFFKVCWFDFTMWVRFLLHLTVDEYGEKYWRFNLKQK